MQGKVADYIPELSKANPMHLGLCIKTPDRQSIEYGDVLETMDLYFRRCSLSVTARSLEHLSREMHLHIFGSENV